MHFSEVNNGRSEVRMKELSWINRILGLWLIVAGLTMSSAAPAVMTEEIVIGIVVTCLASVAAGRPSWFVSGLVAAAGLWALLAPAAIDYAGMTNSLNNDIVVGSAVLVLGTVNAAFRQRQVPSHA
jgi:nitrate reductase gamma subunit